MIGWALLLLAGALMLSFWDELKDWVKSVVHGVARVLNMVFMATQVLIKKIAEAFEEIARTYQQDADGQWHETTRTRTVPAHEVPEEIRAKARIAYEEVDISQELERELQLVQ